MSVENLSKLQISAVKKMAKSITPLENMVARTKTKLSAYIATKQAEVDAKLAEFESIIEQNEAEIANINQAIATYTGGTTLQEIMHPEANMNESEVNVGEVDDTVTVDMQEISSMSNEEVEEPQTEA